MGNRWLLWLGFSSAWLTQVGCNPDEVIAHGESAGAAGAGGSGGTAVTAGSGSLVPACDLSAPALHASPQGKCEKGSGFCWENPLPFGSKTELASQPAIGETWIEQGGQLLRLVDGEWTPFELPAGIEIYTAHVIAADDIWISGVIDFEMLLVHYDGERWTTHAKGVDVPLELRGGSGGLWGRLEDDVFKRFDGSSWLEVPALPDAEATISDFMVVGSDEAWALGFERLFHFVDGAWATITTDEAFAITSGFARAGDDVWFTGWETITNDIDEESERGAVWRWNGAELSQLEVPEVSLIRSVAGDADDVWFGCDEGEILHHDGAELAIEDFRAPLSVNGLSIQGADDVWAVGYEYASGNVWHFDGERWSDASVAPTRFDLNAVWGRAVDDVWAVGEGGLKLHFDGERWSERSEGDADYSALWGSGDALWAIAQGGTLERLDGESWLLEHDFGSEVAGLWGLPSGTLFVGSAADNDSPKLYRYSPDGAVDELEAPSSALSIWASSASDVWLVGDGPVYRFDGSEWHTMVVEEDTFDFTAVWGRSANDVFVAGFWGLYHYNGTIWTRIDEDGNGPDLHEPSTIRGCGSDHIWLSDFTRVLAYDGQTLTSMLEDSTDLKGIWGVSPQHLITVGDNGAVLRLAQ
jgi:hypothetical protein